MNLNDKLKYSHRINNTLSNLITLDLDDFNYCGKVILTYLKIILQHHKSITKLINENTLSALCLIRPMNEAYIKVTWLMNFYGTPKVDKVLSKINDRNDNDSFPSLDNMAKQIDEELSKVQNSENKNIMFNHLKNNKKLYNSYTHVGSYLLSLMINKNDKFTDEDKIEILNEMAACLLLSFNAYVFITKDISILKRIQSELNLLNCTI